MRGEKEGRDPPASTRKPYRVSKQRCPWSTAEHTLFLEAIDRYGRAWPKIVAHIGTRSVQQARAPPEGWPVRSHAQKYFLKLEKAGNQDAVPPPRPKKRAARPYPTSASRRARGERPGRGSAGRGDASGGDDSEGADWPASGEDTAPGWGAGVATTRAAARARADGERGRRKSGDPASSVKAEGDGSTGEHSGGTCPDNSGLSTGDNVCPSGLEIDLDMPRGSFAMPPLKRDVGDRGAQHAAPGSSHERAEPGAAAADAPACGGGGEIGRLYDLVGSLYEVGPEAHQRMLEQLEPTQRASLVTMMGRLAGNLRGDVDAAPPGAAPTPFAAPAVQTPADVSQTLARAGMPQAFSLPPALEPLRDAPGAGSAGAHGLEPFGAGKAGLGSGPAPSSGRLLDESSSVPQLVGLPEPLAPQPEAELLTTAIPHAAPQSYPNPSSVSSNTRAGGTSACESGGGAHSAFHGDRAAAAREAQRLFLLAQQQYAQVAPLALPGANVEQLRIAAQLAHHQAELAQAQMLALPPALLPAPLLLAADAAQSAPSVPPDFLPKWQTECEPAYQADGDSGGDLLMPGLYSF